MKRATFCWSGEGKSDRTKVRTVAMAAASAPAPRMMVTVRFHHRNAGALGGLACRADGLGGRPEGLLLRLVITRIPEGPFFLTSTRISMGGSQHGLRFPLGSQSCVRSYVSHSFVRGPG
jgi:hypothetical protein